MAESEKTLWQKTKENSKAGFDKIWAAADKLGAPVNKFSNKLGSEAFWPTTLDKESDKAARILRSFCKDGFYSEEVKSDPNAPKGKQRVVKKIPSSVIAKAKGLAIFTTMRSGLWISGAGGSGVVVARKEDGTWSEPSGILLHTAGLGWLIGVDIYDCVLVLNSTEAVDAFRNLRFTLGGELSAVAGPVGAGGVMDTEVHKRQAAIFTYMKSRGFYAGVQVDGTVMIERKDENERFYHEKISAIDILAGKVRHPPQRELQMLRATLKAAQGDAVDESELPSDAAPSDFQIEEPGHIPSVPDPEDPDPYGVRALEMEGISIKDASTHEPVPEEVFTFHPSEKSPLYHAYKKSMSGSINGESQHPSSQDLTVPTHDLGQAQAESSMAHDGQLASSPTHDDVFEEASEAPLPAAPKPRGPPPALPPRATPQPIEMEDVELAGETKEEETKKEVGMEEEIKEEEKDKDEEISVTKDEEGKEDKKD